MLQTCEVIIGSADKFDMKLTFIGGNKSSVTACVADHWHGKNNNNNNDRLTAFDPGQPG